MPSPEPAPDPIALQHQEVERLDAQLRDLEGRLASLQRTRAAGLGEDIDPALQRVEALTREAARAEARLRAGRQRRAELESQLSSVPPTVPARQEAQPEETAAGPDRAGPNRQKLQELKTKLTALQRILGAAHPQVAELTRQIDTLEATTAPPPRPARREQPPSVANPALAALREQIASLDAELARDEADRAAALSKLSYEKERLRTSSRVAEEHAALSRARDELRRRREEMAARWVQVRPAEKETPAPGFVLVEAARLPDSPEGLGRRPIALAGAALSLLGGMLSAGLRGRRLRPVASPERAQELTGLPVLGVVPLVRAPRELEGG